MIQNFRSDIRINYKQICFGIYITFVTYRPCHAFVVIGLKKKIMSKILV